MQTRWKPAATLMILAVAASPLAAAQAPAATRADLAIDLAGAAGFVLPAQGAAGAAADLLRRSGIDLGSDLGAPATQRLLTDVGRAVGAAVTGARPDGPISRATGRAFAGVIRSPLRAAIAQSRGGSDLIHASCQGRESRSGRKGAPASPSDPNASAPPCEEPIP